MKAFREAAWLSCLLFLAGCSSWGKEEIPWYLGIAAPEHYDMWVINLHVEKSGERSWRIPVGHKGCCWQGDFGPFGTGGSLEPFPNLIALHWFSFAEQKYYSTLIRVPPGLQDRMRVPVRTTSPNGMVRDLPRSTLVLGLAPGGEVVVWIMSQRTNAVEVMRVPAVEVEGNLDAFRVRTEQYLEKHGAYLEAHGVPLAGW
ncbi:DUF2931 family protein [Marinobacter zhejiangensis]|uniref:DUF2931 family protein n=1 Tax=Marinobacter zhejiangensis TaxID=488535 RepID=A0A1I4N6R1_9GAMM|nr:DUF2931 family protein [Marinobacter zhejiangensis]SFM11168.1 Protein of unknown function [Marinobacter zhejiangensis]